MVADILSDPAAFHHYARARADMHSANASAASEADALGAYLLDRLRIVDQSHSEEPARVLIGYSCESLNDFYTRRELGLEEMAVVTGPGGKLEVPVEITDAIRPRVVSLPHDWGHTEPGTRMQVAAREPGVNVNNLNDGTLLDPLSGTAVLNALPVEVARAG